MSFSPFVREFRALANSAKLTAGAPDFDMNHSRNSPYHPRQIRRTLCPAKKPRLRLHDIVSEGAHVSRDSRQSKSVGIQGCGVWCLEWRRFAAKNRSVTLAGVRIFPGHLSIRPDSPCHRPMEHGRPPPFDSAALPPELHSTQTAARLPESRQYSRHRRQ